MLTSIAHCGDNVDIDHQVESWRMTHEFPKGDIGNVLDFISQHVATLRPEVAVTKLPTAELEVFDPLAHLSEEKDEANTEPMVAPVSGDASPDGARADCGHGKDSRPIDR